MKKTLGTILCAATLICGAASAEAQVLSWEYTLQDVTINYDKGTSIATGDSNSFSWTGGAYDSVITTEDLTGNNTGTVNTGKSIPNRDVVDHGTNTGGGAQFEPGVGQYLGTLTFNYEVMGIDNAATSFDESTLGWKNVTSEISLYTYSQQVDKLNESGEVIGSELVDYVYYLENESEAYNTVLPNGTKILTAVASGDGKEQYNLEGIDLYVDGRAVVGEDGIYVGWTISEFTRQYLIGDKGSTIEKGTLDEDGNPIGEFGKFNIDGTFSIGVTGGGDITDPQPTPEPATMLLMGLGLAGLGFVARRRNK